MLLTVPIKISLCNLQIITFTQHNDGPFQLNHNIKHFMASTILELHALGTTAAAVIADQPTEKSGNKNDRSNWVCLCMLFQYLLFHCLKYIFSWNGKKF